MCGDCGCDPKPTHSQSPVESDTGAAAVTSIPVLEDILSDNDRVAQSTRESLDLAGVVAFNLMSSPGAGKTHLLEVSSESIGSKKMAVIEGDMETENDAERIRARGVQAHQITTGMACHLNADLVAEGLNHVRLSDLDYLFIENVGNLICPANFDLGQHANIVLLTVTEGDDKPQKYPSIFRAADLVLITKTDLLPVLDDFDIERARRNINRIQPHAPIIEFSAKTGEGLTAWLEWLSAFSSNGAPRVSHP